MLLKKHEKKLLPKPTEAMLEQVRRESEEDAMAFDMKKYLLGLKNNPVLLASWEHPYSFDEACKQYGIE